MQSPWFMSIFQALPYTSAFDYMISTQPPKTSSSLLKMSRASCSCLPKKKKTPNTLIDISPQLMINNRAVPGIYKKKNEGESKKGINYQINLNQIQTLFVFFWWWQRGRSSGLWIKRSWVQVLALPFIHYVILGKNLCDPPFPHLEHRDKNITQVMF